MQSVLKEYWRVEGVQRGVCNSSGRNVRDGNSGNKDNIGEQMIRIDKE